AQTFKTRLSDDDDEPEAAPESADASSSTLDLSGKIPPRKEGADDPPA
ncbi:unnamed protein product, partial [marine sediment metagenome]